jgi:hypothetical protein
MRSWGNGTVLLVLAGVAAVLLGLPALAVYLIAG